MKDVMIDFETFGRGPNACICQVGAVYFDKVTGELGKEFAANIDAGTHQLSGAEFDASTIYFWLQQSEAARMSLFGDLQDAHTAMSALNAFLADATRIWSHATFDFVILTNALQRLGIKQSFKYKAGLDLRTLVYVAGINIDGFPREGTHHNGLADAKHQVKYTVAALNAVKTNKNAIALLNRLVTD